MYKNEIIINFMLYTTQLAIIFECKVVESGYMYLSSKKNDQMPGQNDLINSLLSETKSLKRITGRNLLVQRVKNQIPRIKTFTYEAVLDFIALGEHYNHQHFHNARISFCDKSK